MRNRIRIHSTGLKCFIFCASSVAELVLFGSPEKLLKSFRLDSQRNFLIIFILAQKLHLGL